MTTTQRTATAPDGTTVSINRTKAPTHMFLLVAPSDEKRWTGWAAVSAGTLKSCETQARAYSRANERHPDAEQFVFAIVEAHTN